MDISKYLPRGRRVSAVLACGGKSLRMGENKMLIDIDGKSTIRRSAEVVLSCPDVETLVIAAPKELWDIYFRELSGLRLEPLFADSGATRSESVRNAVALCDGDIVLIHDGGRPLVTEREIRDSIDDAFKYGSSVICTPVKDTIRQINGKSSYSPPREQLFTVRTPQTFSLSLYRYALEKTDGEFTDDAQLLDAIGAPVHITIGEYRNIKLTTPDDLFIARQILGGKNMEMRVGHGYDVHRLVEGRKLILGGVNISSDKGLLGHSDADVLLHAAMDAILGALAIGDIGKLFPDTDPKYEGADSLELFKKVIGSVKAQGGRLVNLDVTVIAQAPKLSPYIDQMRENLASAANVDVGRISIKATTEEGLGFTGRREGIAAHAVAIVERSVL